MVLSAKSARKLHNKPISLRKGIKKNSFFISKSFAHFALENRKSYCKLLRGFFLNSLKHFREFRVWREAGQQEENIVSFKHWARRPCCYLITEDTHRVFSQRKETIFWSSELLLPSRVVLSTGRVNSLSGPASAFGGLLFSEKGLQYFSYTYHKRWSLKPQH